MTPSDSVWRDLVRFYLQCDAPLPPAEPRLLPALLSSYRDLADVRYAYPLCLSATAALPLKEVIDGIAQSGTAEGEEREVLRRHLYRLEARIKRMMRNGRPKRLDGLWSAASETLLEETEAEKRPRLEASLHRAREEWKDDGLVVGCNPDSPVYLFHAVAERVHREKIGPFRSELDDLVERLRETLRSESARSSEANGAGTPDAEVDAGSLAAVVPPRGESSPERTNRIRRVLEVLERERVNFEYPSRCTNPAEIGPELQAALIRWTSFFKASRIGRLEVENRYHESTYDAYFDRFGPSDLSEEERALLPPFLVSLRDDSLDAAGRCAIDDLLASGLPVKILLRVTDLFSVDETPTWGAREGARAVGLGGDACVLQTVLSDASGLSAGMAEALRDPGPALLSVYVGRPEACPDLPIYLVTAAALESRAFPFFFYHPRRGTTWAEQFRIDSNPSFDRSHVEGTLPGDDACTISFTVADLLAVDRRWARHFRPAPEGIREERLSPIDALPDTEGSAALPYLWMIEPGKGPRRVLVSRTVLRAVRRCDESWRRLQELGGVGNSHARRAVDEERTRLEEESRARIRELERAYENRMERSLGELSREIVGRIAAGLLGEGGSWPEKIREEEKKEERPAEESAKEEETREADEPLALDDPYIDTPLCTSCDDCTKRNPLLFAYNENKQAYIKDASAGSYRDLVTAAEQCPVAIIHPGRPKNPSEPGLEELIERAKKFLG